MGFSASNTELWSNVLQLMIVSAALVAANLIRRKVKIFSKLLLPVSILAGFMLLILREVGLIAIDLNFMEGITYHAIAIGFIALALRADIETSDPKQKTAGLKSGMIIVGSYLIQAIVGLAITITFSYTLFPNLFKAAGVLLPMGFGQGPGQANNIGATYESTYGFVGGQSFGLAIATLGFLWACIGGISYLVVKVRRGKLKLSGHSEYAQPLADEDIQNKNEIPLTDAVDKFTIQVSMVFFIYLLTYLLSLGLTSLFSAISEGLASTLNSLVWGFNFIIGSSLGLLVKMLLKKMRKAKIMRRQYQNNFMLNRIGGIAFDFMIVASVASIEISALKELWPTLIAITTVGGFVTMFYLTKVCRRVYPDHYYEGFVSMYGMMTGTISTGVLLLREIDPDFKTPASQNMVLGSSTAIVLAAPILVLVGLAPKSDAMTFMVLGICAVYFAVLMFFIFKKTKAEKRAQSCDK